MCEPTNGRGRRRRYRLTIRKVEIKHDLAHAFEVTFWAPIKAMRRTWTAFQVCVLHNRITGAIGVVPKNLARISPQSKHLLSERRCNGDEVVIEGKDCPRLFYDTRHLVETVLSTRIVNLRARAEYRLIAL